MNKHFRLKTKTKATGLCGALQHLPSKQSSCFDRRLSLTFLMFFSNVFSSFLLFFSQDARHLLH